MGRQRLTMVPCHVRVVRRSLSFGGQAGLTEFSVFLTWITNAFSGNDGLS